MSRLDEIAKDCFLNYSNEVIKQRAIPSVEDGMKPIHRRIIYIMKDTGNLSNKPTKKCAKIVGDVMGRLHPHGDTSIYDSLIRLSQPWKMRYPLIEIQGNLGNVLGDDAAAMRYTECRLSEIGELMVTDINKECVPFIENYSGTEQEPVFLTSEFPNILVNPNLGIAVGMSSTTLPHNLREMCDAIIYVIDNKDATTKDLMSIIKGPDFPTGGVITNKNELLNIYENGGTIKIRSKYRIEKVGNKQHIVIYEVPYLVSPIDKIFNKIKDMVLEDNYKDIENIQNNTGRQGLELRVILSKDANINKVISDLCSKTGFESTISFNGNVLSKESPVKLNYLGLIQKYIEHRSSCIIKAAMYDKNKIEEKLIILEGLIKALSIIDDIIKCIKTSENKKQAKEKLIKDFNFLDIQAESILNMKLSKLTSLETEELNKEKEEAVKEIEHLSDIISNKDGKRDTKIKKQLKDIKEKFGDHRRTEILDETAVIKKSKPTEWINIITKQKEIIPILAPTQETILKNIDTQNILFSFRTLNINTSYLFDDVGKMYKLENSNYNINSKNVLDEHNYCAAIPTIEKDFLIFITENGIVKKTKITEYNDRKQVQAIKIKDNDKLIDVYCVTDEDYLMMVTSEGRVLKLKVSDIKESGRATIGSKACADKVISTTVSSNNRDLILTINKEYQAKYTYQEDFELGTRGTKGQKVADNTICISCNPKYMWIDDKIKILDMNTFAIKSRQALGAKVNFKKNLFLIK